jgi:hypothetical protein
MAESIMKTDYDPTTAYVEDSEAKQMGASANDANNEEHNMTFSSVWRNHKTVIWWSFYWAMCSTGWCDSSLLL